MRTPSLLMSLLLGTVCLAEQLGPRQSAFWIAKLKDEDPNVRSKAVRALGNFKSDGVVSALAGALKDQDADVRLYAAQALEEVQIWSEDSLVALILAIDDTDRRVRVAAYNALAELRRPDPERQCARPESDVLDIAVSRFVQELDSRDEQVRDRARALLPKIGMCPRDKALVPVLLRYIGSDDEDLALVAAYCLVDIGQSMDRTVPVFTKLLMMRDPFFKISGAFCLAKVGPDARSAVPTLKDMTRDKRQDVRDAAEKAIKKITSDAGTQ